MTHISKRQHAQFYIYKKKNPEMFIYMHKQQDTLTISKTIHVKYLFTKNQTLYVTWFFNKYFKLAFKCIQEA